MFKKIIAIMSITCFAIGGIVSDRSIYTINDYGITHAYNGSFWYDQGWVDFSPDALHTYTIKVYVKKNGARTGQKNTTVAPGVRTTCRSQQVQGSGGEADWDVVVWV